MPTNIETWRGEDGYTYTMGYCLDERNVLPLYFNTASTNWHCAQCGKTNVAAFLTNTTSNDEEIQIDRAVINYESWKGMGKVKGELLKEVSDSAFMGEPIRLGQRLWRGLDLEDVREIAEFWCDTMTVQDDMRIAFIEGVYEGFGTGDLTRRAIDEGSY